MKIREGKRTGDVVHDVLDVLLEGGIVSDHDGDVVGLGSLEVLARVDASLVEDRVGGVIEELVDGLTGTMQVQRTVIDNSLGLFFLSVSKDVYLQGGMRERRGERGRRRI